MKKISPMSWKDEIGNVSMEEKHLPSIRISHKHLPESKNMKFGSSYNVHMKVRHVGMDKNHTNFEITHIGTPNKEVVTKQVSRIAKSKV